MDDQYLKTVINKHKQHAVAMTAHEVAAHIAQKATSQPKNHRQKAIYLTVFILLGAGIYLIKYIKPIPPKPAPIVSTSPRYTIPQNTRAPIATNTKNKQKQSPAKTMVTAPQNIPDTRHINNIDKEDYTTYNNIADINSPDLYNNINTIISTN